MDKEKEVATGGRSKMLEEGKPLPWRFVGMTTWTKLANKLDLINPVSNNDWRGLAEKLGFSTEDILVFDSRSERKTILIFTHYMQLADATVNKVASALKEMNRDDAFNILLDALPEIENRYKEQLKTRQEIRDMSQNEGLCHFQGDPLPSHYSGHYGGPSCSCHTQHRCSLLTGTCCCHATSHHLHSNPCHLSSLHCSSLAAHNHVHTVPGIPVETFVGQSVAASATASGIASMSSKSSVYNSAQIMLSEHKGFGLHSGNFGLSGQNKNDIEQNVSMIVQANPDCDDGALHSFPSDIPMLETDREQEVPAPLPNTIARGQNRLVSMSALNVPPLLNQNDEVMKDDDGPSTTSTDLSSSSSGCGLGMKSIANKAPNHYNILRQVSEESNTKIPHGMISATQLGMPSNTMYHNKQDMVALASSKEVNNGQKMQWSITNRVIGWNGNNIQPVAAGNLGVEGHSGLIEASSNLGGHRTNGMVTSTGMNKASQSSLQHLMNLSKLPDRFQPGSKYTTIVAEQQIDDLVSSKPILIKQEGNEKSSFCLYTNKNGSNSSGGNKLQNGSGDNPNTFPMRVKPTLLGATMKDVRKLQPGQLKKTTSVPIDMKVEEFRKAFRHIKVFVTYANDTKQHSRQVLSLCNCLDRNGFSCCVDVYSRHDSSPNQEQESRDWCARKFKEADFILVCLSPQYLQEIQTINSARITDPRGLLHAAHVYLLMHEEYQKTSRCSRFVPITFEGSENLQCPTWLTRNQKYHWPQEYKDLLWMLTKPEDRIKQQKFAVDRRHAVLKVNGRCSP